MKLIKEFGKHKRRLRNTGKNPNDVNGIFWKLVLELNLDVYRATYQKVYFASDDSGEMRLADDILTWTPFSIKEAAKKIYDAQG